MNPPGLSLLAFNIGNPSPERAQQQLAWLASRDEHILVLTETKASAGCQLLAGAFAAAGYHITYPEPGPGEYGTVIISRVAAAPDGFGDQIGYLPSRAAAVILPAPAAAAADPARRGTACSWLWKGMSSCMPLTCSWPGARFSPTCSRFTRPVRGHITAIKLP